jgi:hypothetical protein
MIQAETFNVGDQVRTFDSDDPLIVRSVTIRGGRTWYRVEYIGAPRDAGGGTWWAMHDELQPTDAL